MVYGRRSHPGPADRLMIYLILFISECLTKLAPTPGRPSPGYQDAVKQLSTLAVDNFALPGDAGFPLNSLYHPPASKADAGESRPVDPYDRVGWKLTNRRAAIVSDSNETGGRAETG
jgi:hypothetical protein